MITEVYKLSSKSEAIAFCVAIYIQQN